MQVASLPCGYVARRPFCKSCKRQCATALGYHFASGVVDGTATWLADSAANVVGDRAATALRYHAASGVVDGAATALRNHAANGVEKSFPLRSYARNVCN